jgi:hypothetical protein
MVFQGLEAHIVIEIESEKGDESGDQDSQGDHAPRCEGLGFSFVRSVILGGVRHINLGRIARRQTVRPWGSSSFDCPVHATSNLLFVENGFSPLLGGRHWGNLAVTPAIVQSTPFTNR